MIQGLTYDELNALVGMKRSVPYEQYFGEMSIPEEGKSRRTELAEDLEDEFLLALSMMFTMQQYGNMDWDSVRRSLEEGYRAAMGRYVSPDEFLESYATTFAFDVIETTRNHADTPYYYSTDRAMYMAENEANTVLNHDDYSGAVRSGRTRKRWIAIRDGVTRPTHLEVDYKEIPINDLFQVGGSLMRFPKDLAYSPSPEEYINCSILYI